MARMGSGVGSVSERAIAAHNAMATPELGTWTPERHWSRARCIHTGCSRPCCLETCPVCYVSEDDMQTESDAESSPPGSPMQDDMCERCGLHPTCGMSVSYNGSWPPTHLCRPCYDAETQPQQPHAFTGQGHRLGE